MQSEKRKILIIDDDLPISDMLKTLLEFNDFDAVTSDKPLLAKEDILKHQVDLVILDVRLSGVDGLEVCRGLKQDKEVAHIPILMMSALSGIENSCLNGGAQGFISKPFEMGILLEKIDSVL